MGAHYEFRCEGCGLAATISGGPDRGFDCKTQTVWCPSCSTLQDVVVAEDNADDPYPPLIQEFTEVVAKCDECGSDYLVIWLAGQPCPQCEGVMTQSDMPYELWD